MVHFKRKKSIFFNRQVLMFTIDGKKYELNTDDVLSLDLELGVHNFIITLNKQMKAYRFTLEKKDDYEIVFDNYLVLEAKSKVLELIRF